MAEFAVLSVLIDDLDLMTGSNHFSAYIITRRLSKVLNPMICIVLSNHFKNEILSI